MKTKLELLRAAQETAVKLLAGEFNSRQATDVITQGFDALSIDPKHFDEFSKLVGEETYKFLQLSKTPLEPAPAAAAQP